MAHPSSKVISQLACSTDKQHKAELRQILENLASAPTHSVYGLLSTSAQVMRLVDIAQTCRPGKRKNAPVISSARTLDGERAIHLLARRLKPDLCGLLIARGVSVAVKDISGNTAAHYVAEHKMTGDVRAREARVVNVLATAGVDLDARNKCRQTALEKACSRGNVGVAAALLGAPGERSGWERDKVVVINEMTSPLWCAMSCRRIEIVRMLLEEFRPKVMVMQNCREYWKYKNLEDWARKEGHNDILELLMTLPVVQTCRTCGRENAL
eukprot:Plantae.Rhodophyta-Palmaria_palmata.ctg15908.p1 GENE.Plantae.Rhodophyta-Palmaria_palmata.ctg15908~~Plantae.Rhodophyta-Palmaria_palmata.ctg15908.p1  ORF type:complete len:269 (-),score=31.04 Plantae.Rhodophyta-Palmaria_palmata.ctg15908:11-817(-)